ncbi:MAG: hypothetical protein CMC93_04435 [Flavobacteriaceae bacterium]|nr:hypothetical protein [Flavobacteriaceae bacterium]
MKPLIAISLFLSILSCSKDDPVPVHEQEAFTLVTLEVTKVGSTETITYDFEVEGHDHAHEEEAHEEEEDDHDDHEGEHTEIELESNSSYNVSISFYNDEDPNNIINITSEIIAEADLHQVFYDITNELTGFEIVPATNDTTDSNGNPLFIKTTWTTTGETSGDVVGYLFHEPTSKTGTTRSDFGGAIDIEIEFEVHVE